MATFVLVHGAWHGGWCWSRLIPLLEAAGHRAFGPSLTGLGDRTDRLSPEVGLSTHIQDVVELIQEQDLRQVILVGHSYGGMVITGVADRVPDQVAHLVYLDTVVPRDGKAMLDSAPLLRALFRWQTRHRGDSWRVDPPRGNSFGVTAEPDVTWVRQMVTPQPLKTFEEPLHLSDPDIVSHFPRTHICCTGRGRLESFLQLIAQRVLLPKEPGWRLRQLPTGHDAMITMPRELAGLLLEVADTVRLQPVD
jgi:pimeloyl-ACP methyl ester carboxylesterase